MTPSTLTKRFAAMLPMLAVVILGTWVVSADVIAAGRGIWVAQVVLTGILSVLCFLWSRLSGSVYARRASQTPHTPARSS